MPDMFTEGVPDVVIHRRRPLWAGPVREHLGRGLWMAPLIGVAISLLLALVMVRIDHHTSLSNRRWWAFSGDPASAQEVLSTIATAVLTFTGLVFSIMIVALQLASSQFSPRVMRTFMRDKITRATLATFIATFVYTLAVLQSVRERGRGGQPFVPGYAVSVSMVLAIITVMVFAYFVYHMATAIQVVSIMESVVAETRATIQRQFPAAVPLDQVTSLPADDLAAQRRNALAVVADVPSIVVGSGRAGVLTDYDVEQLVELATRNDVVIELLHPLGEHVPGGAPVVRVHGTTDTELTRSLHRHIGIAAQRTMDQDFAFGFRQLVDIATRAASPAMDDSTTAVQALNRIHDLMRNLAARRFPTGIHHDDAGDLRLVVPTESWADTVQLAFAEVRISAEGSLSLARRLRTVLDHLIAFVSPARRVALVEMLAEWRDTVDRGFAEPADRERAGAGAARQRLEHESDAASR